MEVADDWGPKDIRSTYQREANEEEIATGVSDVFSVGLGGIDSFFSTTVPLLCHFSTVPLLIPRTVGIDTRVGIAFSSGG